MTQLIENKPPRPALIATLLRFSPPRAPFSNRQRTPIKNGRKLLKIKESDVL
jgi:hypothetical protein